MNIFIKARPDQFDFSESVSRVKKTLIFQQEIRETKKVCVFFNPGVGTKLARVYSCVVMINSYVRQAKFSRTLCHQHLRGVEVRLLCDEFSSLARCQMLHTRYIEFGHST